MKTNVPTRRSEISFYTSDPAAMLNKYIAEPVIKTYTQTFINKETGETTEIERSERLFDRGTLIDQNTLESIRFSLAAGEIRRIRISNQCRQAKESTSYSHFPFRAKAIINHKPHTFIFYAKSLRTALLILADYIELNFEGNFAITEIRATDYITILTDPGYILPEDEAEDIYPPYDTDEDDGTLLFDYASTGSAHCVKGKCFEENKEGEEDETKNHRFYQITAHITTITSTPSKDDKIERDQTFLIRTSSCARANRIILFWLRLRLLHENRKKLAKDPEATIEEKTFFSQVEESKVVPIRHYIPLEFSLAYSYYDDPANQPSDQSGSLPIGSYTIDTPPTYSNTEK
ncbi:hypothetical protein HDR61_05405 [bacterium]|nr:hypothetical protein [bacterium]